MAESHSDSYILHQKGMWLLLSLTALPAFPNPLPQTSPTCPFLPPLLLVPPTNMASLGSLQQTVGEKKKEQNLSQSDIVCPAAATAPKAQNKSFRSNLSEPVTYLNKSLVLVTDHWLRKCPEAALNNSLLTEKLALSNPMETQVIKPELP